MTDSYTAPAAGPRQGPMVLIALMALIASVVLSGCGSRSPKTPEPSASPVTFNAVGDFGQTDRTGEVLDAIAAAGDDFTLALGDLSYGMAGDEQEWCDFVTSRVGQKYPFELIVGNHDQGRNGNIDDFAACLPNRLPGLVGSYGHQWYVDYPAADPLMRVVMVSPNITFEDGTRYDYSAGTDRYTWTAKAIDSARDAGIPWVVVGMHYPCLSLGMYGCSATYGAGPDLTELLLDKRVDVVLTGHEHLYQRTKQLALGSGCPNLTIGGYQPACVANPGSSMAKGAGTVFVTSGLGGYDPRPVTLDHPELGYFASYRGTNISPGFGFVRFTVTPDGMTGTFQSTSGEVTDTFTLGRPTSDGAPPSSSTSPPLAKDTFSRTVPAGWGSPDVGGTWDISSPSMFSVSDGAGQIMMGPGQGGSAMLPTELSAGTDQTFTVRPVALPAGGSGVYLTAVPRRVTDGGEYRAKLRVQADGAVTIGLSSVDAAGTETILGAEQPAGLTAAPDEPIAVRVQAAGSAPTTLRVKTWPAGADEPAQWQLTATDDAPELQAPGSAGLSTYLSGASTAESVTLSIDDYVVTAP